MFDPYITLYSDDGKLMGDIRDWGKHQMRGKPHINVSIFIKRGGPDWWFQIGSKSFLNRKEGEDWLLDKLECPTFTILQSML